MNPESAERIIKYAEPDRIVDDATIQLVIEVIRVIKNSHETYKIIAAIPSFSDVSKKIISLKKALQKIQKLTELQPSWNSSIVSLLERPRPEIPVPSSTNPKTPNSVIVSRSASPKSAAYASWRQQNQSLLDDINLTLAQIPRSRDDVRIAIAHDYVFNNIMVTNWFTESEGPDSALIAKIYMERQFLFGPTTWPNDLDASPTGGPAVRFAIKLLDELDILDPRTKLSFTPRQIITVWTRYFGRATV